MAISKTKMGVAAVTVGLMGSTILWLYAEQLDSEHEALVADQVEVVKAAENIPARTPLTKDRITTEKVPRKFLPPNPLLESELNIYLGSPVAVNVEEGAMMLTSDFSVAEVERSTAEALVSPLVIKTATLRLEAKTPVTQGQEALQSVAMLGGYIVSSDIYSNRETQSFSMVARVPAHQFETALLGFNQLGATVEQRIRGAGVAADVRKLEKKIGNTEFLVEGLRHAKKKEKKASVELQQIEIISGDGNDRTVTTRTSQSTNGGETARELAKAEHALDELEAEMEQLQAETALATIELTITQPISEPPPQVEKPLGEVVADEFMDSSRSIVRGTFGALRALAAALPLLVLVSPLFLAGAFWIRRRRKGLVA